MQLNESCSDDSDCPGVRCVMAFLAPVHAETFLDGRKRPRDTCVAVQCPDVCSDECSRESDVWVVWLQETSSAILPWDAPCSRATAVEPTTVWSLPLSSRWIVQVCSWFTSSRFKWRSADRAACCGFSHAERWPSWTAADPGCADCYGALLCDGGTCT